MPQKEQDDIIERLRKRVDESVKMAVHLIAANGRTVVQGDLDKITIKDGAQALIKIGKSVSALHELAEAQGQAVLLVLSGGDSQYTGGMDEVRGESDQRSFEMGREYTDGDGDGMPDASSPSERDVIDAEFKEISAQPLQEELEAVYEHGYSAASEGKPESDCPVMAGALCIEWVKGWKAWHEEHAEEDPLYGQVRAFVIAQQRVSVSQIRREFSIGYGRAARIVERLEERGSSVRLTRMEIAASSTTAVNVKGAA